MLGQSTSGECYTVVTFESCFCCSLLLMDIQTDRHTDTKTDITDSLQEIDSRHTNRKTDRQKDRQEERWTGRKTDKKKDRQAEHKKTDMGSVQGDGAKDCVSVKVTFENMPC